MNHQANVETYHQVSSDDDTVGRMRQILVDNDFSTKQIDIFDTHIKVRLAIHKVYSVKIHLLNRFWNLQLLTVGAKSINVRSHLVHVPDPDDYLSVFAEVVVPFLKQNDLPTSV